jgi:hypothetical protein
MAAENLATSSTAITREIDRLESLLREPGDDRGGAPGDRERQEDIRRRITFLRAEHARHRDLNR